VFSYDKEDEWSDHVRNFHARNARNLSPARQLKNCTFCDQESILRISITAGNFF
jgi:hypothetical protein